MFIVELKGVVDDIEDVVDARSGLVSCSVVVVVS